MAHQQMLAKFKTISIDDLQTKSREISGRHMPRSAEKVREITARYFMGNEKEVSARMGSREERQKLASELEKAKGELKAEFEALRPVVIVKNDRVRGMHKAAMALGAAGGLGAALSWVSGLPQLHGINFFDYAQKLLGFMVAASGILVMAGSAVGFASHLVQSKYEKIVHEATAVKDYIESAVTFAGQQWKSQVIGAFRR